MSSDVIIGLIEFAKPLVNSVWRQVDYFWNYKDHIGELQSDAAKLEQEMAALESVKIDEERKGKKIVSPLILWENKGNKLLEKAKPFSTNNENEGSENNKCSVVFRSNWRKRYQHGQKAKKISEKIKKHVGNKITGPIAHNGSDQVTIEPVKDYQEFESRRSIVKDILKALKSPGVAKIGVYGISGMGKTTLVKQIAFEAHNEKLIDQVATVRVFQEQNIPEKVGEEAVTPDIKRIQAVTPDIKRIQGEIAERLNITLQNKEVKAIADELRKRLTDQKETKRLIILNDIWVGLKLEDIGIPDDHAKCKILMTSTNEKVLRAMKSTKIFQLDVLEPHEAREWFKNMVGAVDKDSIIEQVADDVADKCACFPILLHKIAQDQLEDTKNFIDWENTKRQLSLGDKGDLHHDVKSAIELSYNLLEEETKKLFQLCGQLPPDGINI